MHENSIPRNVAESGVHDIYYLSLPILFIFLVAANENRYFWGTAFGINILLIIRHRYKRRRLHLNAPKMSESEQLAYLDAEIRRQSSNRQIVSSVPIRSASLQCSYRYLQLQNISGEGYWSTNDGRSFEKKCARFYELLGYTVRLTPSSGDNGIDLIASKGDRFLHIQCKAWSRRVGNSVSNSIVNATVGASHYYLSFGGYGTLEKTKVVIIAASGFTRSAKNSARQLGVELLEINNIRGIVRREMEKEASGGRSHQQTRPRSSERSLSSSSVQQNVTRLQSNSISSSMLPVERPRSVVPSSPASLVSASMARNYELRALFAQNSSTSFVVFESHVVQAVRTFCLSNNIPLSNFNTIGGLLLSNVPGFIKSEVIVARAEFYSQ